MTKNEQEIKYFQEMKETLENILSIEKSILEEALKDFSDEEYTFKVELFLTEEEKERTVEAVANGEESKILSDYSRLKGEYNKEKFIEYFLYLLSRSLGERFASQISDQHSISFDYISEGFRFGSKCKFKNWIKRELAHQEEKQEEIFNDFLMFSKLNYNVEKFINQRFRKKEIAINRWIKEKEEKIVGVKNSLILPLVDRLEYFKILKKYFENEARELISKLSENGAILYFRYAGWRICFIERKKNENSKNF